VKTNLREKGEKFIKKIVRKPEGKIPVGVGRMVILKLVLTI
jgi:hypothetical protein